jgi:hypothetical protein
MKSSIIMSLGALSLLGACDSPSEPSTRSDFAATYVLTGINGNGQPPIKYLVNGQTLYTILADTLRLDANGSVRHAQYTDQGSAIETTGHFTATSNIAKFSAMMGVPIAHFDRLSVGVLTHDALNVSTENQFMLTYARVP